MNKKGFTLIEILAVIVIISIIGLIGISSISNSTEKTRKASYATLAKTIIESARSMRAEDRLPYDLQSGDILLMRIDSLDGTDKIDIRKTEFGDLLLDLSYVIIVNDNNNYQYYITLIDSSKHNIMKTEYSVINEDSVKSSYSLDDVINMSGTTVGSVIRFNEINYEVGTVNDTFIVASTDISQGQPGGNGGDPGTNPGANITNVLRITATTKNTNKQINSGYWTNEGLNFKFTQGTMGTIYYCYDRDNTCSPNIKVNSDENISVMNGETGIYYVRYKIISRTGHGSEVGVFVAKIDTIAPVCSIVDFATVNCSDTGNYENAISKIVKWYYGKKTLPNVTYNTITPSVSINIDKTPDVTDGTYNLYAMDESGNVSVVRQQTYYEVTYDKNGGTTNPTLTRKIVKAGTQEDFTSTFNENKYFFVGWNTNSNATTALTSYTINRNTTFYAIWRNKVYLYNRGDECIADSGGWTFKKIEANGDGSKNSDALYIGRVQVGSSASEFTSNKLIPPGKYNIHILYNKTFTVDNFYGYSYFIFGSEHRWEIPDATIGIHEESVNFETNVPTTVSFGNYDCMDYVYEIYLTPITEENTRAKVTFDLQGGEIVHDYVHVIEFAVPKKGQTMILGARSPSKTGYTFLGWSRDPAATTASYSTAGKYSFIEDTVLYAVWKKS